MSDPQPYDDARELFTEADTRFQQLLGDAFAAHAKCVALFGATLTQIGRREAELQESVDELKRLLLENRGGQP